MRISSECHYNLTSSNFILNHSISPNLSNQRKCFMHEDQKSHLWCQRYPSGVVHLPCDSMCPRSPSLWKFSVFRYVALCSLTSPVSAISPLTHGHFRITCLVFIHRFMTLCTFRGCSLCPGHRAHYVRSIFS